MRKGPDGKEVEKWEKIVEKNGQLMLLPVNLLNGDCLNGN